MMDRSENPNHVYYEHYGGRGIEVCDRWRGENGYKNFIIDMGIRPRNCSLDRIDPDKGYYPENCRWATYEEQHYNKRTTVRFTFMNVTKTALEWERITGIPRGIIRKRINWNGWSIEQALTTPYAQGRHHRPRAVGAET